MKAAAFVLLVLGCLLGSVACTKGYIGTAGPDKTGFTYAPGCEISCEELEHLLGACEALAPTRLLNFAPEPENGEAACHEKCCTTKERRLDSGPEATQAVYDRLALRQNLTPVLQSFWDADPLALSTLVIATAADMEPPIQAGDSVYELGCGVGASLSVLAQQLHVGTVGGVDLSPNAIKQAQTTFPDDPARFVAQDMTIPNAAVPDGTYDHAISIGAAGVYLRQDDLAAALREAVRVTKPGGSVLISMIDESDVPRDFWKAEVLGTMRIKNLRLRTMPENKNTPLGDEKQRWYYLTGTTMDK